MVQRCGTSHNALAILGLAGISLRLPWWNVVWNVYGSFRFTMQTLCSRRTERAAFARRARVWGFMGCSPSAGRCRWLLPDHPTGSALGGILQEDETLRRGREQWAQIETVALAASRTQPSSRQPAQAPASAPRSARRGLGAPGTALPRRRPSGLRSR